MNKEIFEGKFNEIAGTLKKKWGQLTDDEIRKTEGNAQALEGTLQQKAGLSKAEASRDVADMLDALERKLSPEQIKKRP